MLRPCLSPTTNLRANGFVRVRSVGSLSRGTAIGSDASNHEAIVRALADLTGRNIVG